MLVASKSIVFFAVLPLAAACAPAPRASAAAAGTSGCPDAVRQSIAMSYPSATLSSCKLEREDGHDQFEVKLDNGGIEVEVDLAPDGTILQTEVAVPLDQVPSAVMRAFTTKYPNTKPIYVEKQVRPGKGTFYELRCAAEAAREVTFAEDGSFVEEE